MKLELETCLQQAVDELLAGQGEEHAIRVALTRPREKEHGDYAANVAMPLAGHLRQQPHDVAVQLLKLVQWPDAVDSAEIAGPGFINIHLHHATQSDVIKHIVAEGKDYGCAPSLGKSVCLEYVSANPTGPMHVGHGRGAVVGDALANVLATQGLDVHREYYINDAGAQIGMLASSLWVRIKQQIGADVQLAADEYPGEYLIDVAKKVLEKYSFHQLVDMSDEESNRTLASLGVELIMEMIRDDLKAIGIEFDEYFSERALHESGQVQKLINKLKDDGLVYRGVLPPPKGKEVEGYQPVEQWLFRTTQFGDDVDRPLMKQDGTPSYFAADIAYHANKHERGFWRLIDVWGADHGGYVTRVQSAMKALTGQDHQPEVILVQMVNLTREGAPVRMSKRAGTFVTLREVVDEVGRDAVRFNFLTRRAESQLDFDLETAKQQSDENPVYYVQYAHARVCAIRRKAAEAGVDIAAARDADVSVLSAEEEKAIIKQLLAYPEMLDQAASRLEPYRVATYLMQLAASLHNYYHKHRVIGDDKRLSQARLLLVQAIGQVLNNGLGLLGVQAPERM